MPWTTVDDEPKPHVHPLTTPSGLVVTQQDNPDHVWQRGLWFAVKYLDRGEGPVNFWEEEGGHGIQRHAGSVDGAARIEWVGPDLDVWIDEDRSIVDVSTEIDHDAPVTALDWTTALVPRVDLRLDRTPYRGWGGYGGLTLRGPYDWSGTRLLLAGDHPDGGLTVAGQRAPWADLSSADRGVTILDHPANPRHPTPWYGNVHNVLFPPGQWHDFLGAAFLFHEPMDIAAGQPLTFRFRVIAHDGPAGPADGDRWWTAFAR